MTSVYFLLNRLRQFEVRNSKYIDMQTSEVLTTYTCLYIKHVRQHGYNKSLYSFIKQFGESAYICLLANKVINELVRQHYIQRIARQRYGWNTNGKVLLINDVKTIIRSI